VLAIVCPVPDDSTLCGVGVFDASEDQVVRIMDDDPGERAGVFTYELHPVPQLSRRRASAMSTDSSTFIRGSGLIRGRAATDGLRRARREAQNVTRAGSSSGSSQLHHSADASRMNAASRSSASV